MKRWLPILLIVAAGIVVAILLSRDERTSVSSTPPIKLSGQAITRARVSGGGYHALAIAPDGSLWSWGGAMHGEACGLGIVSGPVRHPTRVSKDNDWAEVIAGYSYSLALKRDGSLWAWGGNPAGMLGDGTSQTRNTPVRVGTSNDWLMAGAGLHHSAGLKRDGTIWTWGANSFGELGIPELQKTTNESWVPIRVGMETNWKAIAVSAVHNVALKSNGTLWTWGDSALTPTVAANSPSNHYAPVQIGSDTNWTALAAGYYHTIGLKTDGTLWSWGRNNSLIGGIPAKSAAVPRQFGTNADWAAIYDGAYHNLARRKDGTLWQLGRAGFPGRGGLTNISGDWVTTGGGASFSLAVAPDGSLWHWGNILGVRKDPGWLKRTLGQWLKAVGIQNQLDQSQTPTTQTPERIFQLPTPPER
jgi:alpha-tubulin suppressor-like RCC1 family protein